MARFISSYVPPPSGTGAQVGQLGIAKFTAEANAVLRARALRQERRRIDAQLEAERDRQRLARLLYKQRESLAKMRESGMERRHRETLAGQRDIAAMHERGATARTNAVVQGRIARRGAILNDLADILAPGPASPPGAAASGGAAPAMRQAAPGGPVSTGAQAPPPASLATGAFLGSAVGRIVSPRVGGPVGAAVGAALAPAPQAPAGAARAPATRGPAPLTPLAAPTAATSEDEIKAAAAAKAAQTARVNAVRARQRAVRALALAKHGRGSLTDVRAMVRDAKRAEVEAVKQEEAAKALASIARVKKERSAALGTALASIERADSVDALRSARSAVLGSEKFTPKQKLQLISRAGSREKALRSANERDDLAFLASVLPRIVRNARSLRGNPSARGAIDGQIRSLQREVHRHPTVAVINAVDAARREAYKLAGIGTGEPPDWTKFVSEARTLIGKPIRTVYTREISSSRGVDPDKKALANAKADSETERIIETMIQLATSAVLRGVKRSKFIDSAIATINRMERELPEEERTAKPHRIPHLPILLGKAWDNAEARHAD